MLHINERCRCRVGLLVPEIGFLKGGVDVTVDGAFEVGLFARFEVEAEVIEFVEEVCEY